MKRIIPYPILLITAIILDRVDNSAMQIGAVQILRPLLISLLLTMTLIWIVQWFVSDWHRTNFVVFMAIMMFIIYRPLYRAIKTDYSLDADNLAFILILFLGLLYAVSVGQRIRRLIRNPVSLSYYLNLVFGLLLAFQGVQLGMNLYRHQMSMTISPSLAIHPLDQPIQLEAETRPDIYIIILDGYARQDVLQKIYSYDNSEFINQLRIRGFYVATSNHSNYVQTTYTMASLLNFDYVHPWVPTSDYYQYLFQPTQENRVYNLLDEIGYTTVSFNGSTTYTEIKISDVYLSKFISLNKFESQLLVDSPVEPFSNMFNLGIPIPTYKTHIERILYTLSELKEIPSSIPEPKIVYAHVLAPHPPFIFDRNGNVIPQQRPYRLWDTDVLTDRPQEYWDGYREQVIFLNKQIIESIDSILEKSEPPPIILLMGDHGPGSMFHMDTDSPGCIWERTSNFYALHLPGHENDGTLYPSISPVNTFRVIFNTYFRTNLPLLEDRTYLAAAQFPDKIIDITGITESRDGCTIPAP